MTAPASKRGCEDQITKPSAEHTAGGPELVAAVTMSGALHCYETPNTRGRHTGQRPLGSRNASQRVPLTWESVAHRIKRGSVTYLANYLSRDSAWYTGKFRAPVLITQLGSLAHAPVRVSGDFCHSQLWWQLSNSPARARAA